MTLNDSQKDLVRKLFKEGHGHSTICIKLRLPQGAVRLFLAGEGLHRSYEESKRVKPNGPPKEEKKVFSSFGESMKHLLKTKD